MRLGLRPLRRDSLDLHYGRRVMLRRVIAITPADNILNRRWWQVAPAAPRPLQLRLALEHENWRKVLVNCIKHAPIQGQIGTIFSSRGRLISRIGAGWSGCLIAYKQRPGIRRGPAPAAASAAPACRRRAAARSGGRGRSCRRSPRTRRRACPGPSPQRGGRSAACG